MAFRKIQELTRNKIYVMAGFMICGLVAINLSIMPFLNLFMGTGITTLTLATLINPLLTATALFFLPALYIQSLKKLKQWPMEKESSLHWHMNELMADTALALKRFNAYLPIKNLAVMLGFCYVIWTALRLSVTPWVLAIFGPHPATFTLAFFLNTPIVITSLFFLPGIYFQALKQWQIWPMKKKPMEFTLNPSVLFDDTLEALRQFDWKILNWASALLLSIFFPQLNETQLRVKAKNTYPENAKWWAKSKWIAKEIGFLIGNFWVTLFTDNTIQQIITKAPKNTGAYLFSNGIREGIHIGAYYLKHWRERAYLTLEEREQHFFKDLKEYNLNRVLHADIGAQGLFETFYTSIRDEQLIQASGRFVLNAFSDWKQHIQGNTVKYLSHKAQQCQATAHRVIAPTHQAIRGEDSTPTPR